MWSKLTNQKAWILLPSSVGKKKQIPDFSLSDWPVSGHMIFFSKKILFFLHFSYVFPHFSPPLLHPSTLASWSWHFYFMSSVFNCRSLNVRCTYLLFSSCPLFFPVVYFMSSVFTCPFLPVHCSLALTLDIGMKLRNVSKATHSFFLCLETVKTFNRCTVLACTKPKPSIFPEVCHALNVETVCLLLNCRCGNVAAILELDSCFSSAGKGQFLTGIFF